MKDWEPRTTWRELSIRMKGPPLVNIYNFAPGEIVLSAYGGGAGNAVDVSFVLTGRDAAILAGELATAGMKVAEADQAAIAEARQALASMEAIPEPEPASA